MTEITYDSIKVKSPWTILQLHDVRLRNAVNEHGELWFSALVDEDSGAKAALQETANLALGLYYENEQGTKWLFQGVLQKIEVVVQGQKYEIKAYCKSNTVRLDQTENSRSFQDLSLGYGDIVKQVLQGYEGLSCQDAAAAQSIAGPIIQYRETDWQFIRRMASRQQAALITDCSAAQRIFCYGAPPVTAETELPDTLTYAGGKDMAAYRAARQVNPALSENQFVYWDVETDQPLQLAQAVRFRGRSLRVKQLEARIVAGVLRYSARLVDGALLRSDPADNPKLCGVTLPGKVIGLADQTVKLHLDIDREQNPDTAYWYPFAPPTTDMLYLMPQLNTVAGLYVPGDWEERAICTGNLRTNGASCDKTGDPNTRYLATEYGQELKIAPGGVYLTAGKPQLAVQLDDGNGALLSSHQTMTLLAQEAVLIHSDTKVVFASPNQIAAIASGGGFVMENEMHFKAPLVSIQCSDCSEYPPVEQPKPSEKKGYALSKPGEKKENKINWGAIAVGALAAVAIVAVSVVTFGAGAVVTAALCGAAIGAVGGIACTGFSDLGRGELSSAQTYLESALKGGLIGLVVGAMGGPAAAEMIALEKSLLQIVAFESTLGATGSWLDDMLFNNGNVDLNKMAQAAMISGMFAGVATPLLRRARLPSVADEVGEGIIKRNPLDDPKIAKEIKEDDAAVYGYSPKPESSLNEFNVDWTKPEQVAAARAKRIEYQENLIKKQKMMDDEINKLREQGLSMEDIARMKVEQRNTSRIDSYMKSGNIKGLEAMKARNIKEYGREEGPTADQLYDAKGSWENVVRGSARSSQAMDVLTGLYK